MRKSTAACIAVLFFGVVFFARAILEYGYGQTCSDLERPLFLVPGSPVVMVSVTFLAWVAHFASNALLPYPLHLQLLIVCIYLPLEFFIFRPVLLPWLGKIRDMRKLPARLL